MKIRDIIEKRKAEREAERQQQKELISAQLRKERCRITWPRVKSKLLNIVMSLLVMLYVITVIAYIYVMITTPNTTPNNGFPIIIPKTAPIFY